MLGLSRSTWRQLGLLVLVIVVGLGWLWAQGGSDSDPADPASRPAATSGSSVPARTSTSPRPAATDPASGRAWIAASALPSQAREVLAEIDAGGPFAYPGKDGSTFGNFEGVLPKQKRGYYREYTVPTPGSSSRGARRIVTGSAGEFFWTADHYEHFARIRR